MGGKGNIFTGRKGEKNLSYLPKWFTTKYFTFHTKMVKEKGFMLHAWWILRNALLEQYCYFHVRMFQFSNIQKCTLREENG